MASACGDDCVKTDEDRRVDTMVRQEEEGLAVDEVDVGSEGAKAKELVLKEADGGEKIPDASVEETEEKLGKELLSVSDGGHWLHCARHAWQRLGSMNPEMAMEQYITLLSDNIPGWMPQTNSADGNPTEGDGDSPDKGIFGSGVGFLSSPPENKFFQKDERKLEGHSHIGKCDVPVVSKGSEQDFRSRSGSKGCISFSATCCAL